MSGSTTQYLRLSHVLHRDAPVGLWATLSRLIDEPSMGIGDIWRGAERRVLLASEPTSSGMWSILTERADPSRYRPHAIPDVAEEQLIEGDQTFTIIRSPRGNYLRLTAQQREVWRQMDGTRTVAELATYAFLQFKQLLLVGDLVAALKEEGLLMDHPVGVYRSLNAGLGAQTAEGWGRRVLRLFAGKTWQISNIDGIYTILYRAAGWLFFTRTFFVLWVAITLVGLGAFVLALNRGTATFQVLEMDGSVPRGLLVLWSLLLVSFILHESAHALAVKHYRRVLHGGGVMLYYGMPAAFVDTSDIWRSPRRARIIVSAAGPMSDLMIGGIAAIAALNMPGIALGAIVFKLAFTCYIATLFNANPLLELDGYFILVDWLRLPDLRRRALQFVRSPLWERLWQRASLSREERIFAWYGLATALYTVFAIGMAVWFWNRQLVEPIMRLLEGSPLQRFLGCILLLVVVMPILGGLLLIGLGIGRASINWLVRRGYGRQPALLAGVASALVLAVSWLSGQSSGWLVQVLPLTLWCIALGALLALRPDYRRAAIAPSLNALLLTTGCSALAPIAYMLLPQMPLWAIIDGLGFFFLLLAGFAALLDVDLRQSPQRELLGSVFLIMIAFAVGGLALFNALRTWPEAGFLMHVVIASPAYFGAMALALLLPQLFDLSDSRLIWSWALLWCAVLAKTVAYVVTIDQQALRLDVLAAGLWAATWLVHLATLRQITPDEIVWPHEPSISEAQRLTRAFQFCYAGCYRLLRDVYGARRAKALDDRMDVLSATANWDVTLDRDRVRISEAVLDLSLDGQGARYAEVLRYTVATIEGIAGAAFARRAIQAAYDALPWPERETASRLCFPDTPWARELSNDFGDERATRLRLLRQLDLFLSCDDDDLASLVHSLQEHDLPGGTIILAERTQPPGMWLLEAGEVIAVQDGQVVTEMHRGESFGAQEVLEYTPAMFSYRTTVASSLLFIPAAELRTLLQEQAGHAERDQIATTLRLLERVPLFADIPRHTLRGLANIAQQQTFTPRSVIVRQGHPSGTFYIIKQGLAAVLVRDEPSEDKPAKVRPVAQLGPGEFFGELELLRGTPPVANVVAVQPLTLVSLPHAAIQGLLLGNGGVAKGLEQIGTGRLIALRRQVAT